MRRATGPIRSIKEVLFTFSSNDWKSAKNFWRSAVGGWILFIALVCAVTAVLNVEWEPLPSDIVEDSVALHHIRSDRAYTIVDETATEELKEKARNRVLPVFDYNREYSNIVIDKISSGFAKAREELKRLEEELPEEAESLPPQQIEAIRSQFIGILGVAPTVKDFQRLIDQKFDPALEQALIAAVRKALNEPILEDEDVIEAHKATGLILVSGEGEERGEKAVLSDDLLKMPTVSAIKDQVVLRLEGAEVTPELIASLTALAQQFVTTTAVYDAVETDQRRLAAESAVEDVIIYIHPGESIIRAGDRFDARTISIVEGIKKAKAKRNFRWKFVGTGLFLFCFLLALYVFAARFLQRFRPQFKDLLFLGSALVLAAAIFRIGISILNVLRESLPVTIPSSALYYLLPIAGVVMVVRLLRNAQEAFIFAAASAIVIGLAPDVQFTFVAYYLLGGLVAVGSLSRAETRTAIWRAGLLTGLFQMILVIAFELIRSTEIMVALNVEAQLWNLGCALVGGMLSAAVALAFAGLAESTFAYLTDVRLLELGSLNHPLLRELIVRAPGTYHHSHLVGTLAESGCQAIGANGLFARVASYFHDIGKMAKSDYFVENQTEGLNRHDTLSPSMSALIIQNHVKDGMEMARKAKLPEQIIDIIPQHQGTKLIRYFYSKAKELEDPNVSPVNEKDYRYPGPKPQTREAGVILLADGVEAATRALRDKTPTKIRSVVEKMINQNFTDGQFDDCELTLKDLHDIADAFSNILVAIYHQRIEYPDLPSQEKGGTRLKSHEEHHQHPEPKPIADTLPQETPGVIQHPAGKRRNR